MAESTYVIKPPPPVRAFVIAAVASLLGAVGFVVALGQQWHLAVVILAVVIFALGIALFAGAWGFQLPNTTTITLDDDGYHAVGFARVLTGEWADVTRVSLSQDSARHLTIHHGTDRRSHLVLRTAPQSTVDELVADIQQRLAAAKD